MNKYYILERAGEFDVVSVLGDNDPLYGRGSWDLFDPRSYNSEDEAWDAIATWAIQFSGVAMQFIRKQATWGEMREAAKI